MALRHLGRRAACCTCPRAARAAAAAYLAPRAAASMMLSTAPPPPPPPPSPRRAAAVAALRGAHAVCFDVDSTVITVEGIDELAAFAGKKAAVAALTAQAMGGSVRFEDALAARLALISPTADLLARFLAAHPFAFTPGVRELVAHLQRRGTAVYLVSGGFTQMIHPVADALGVPRGNVFANTILFGGAAEGGAYAGFDASAPTSRDGGKPEVVRRLKAERGCVRAHARVAACRSVTHARVGEGVANKGPVRTRCWPTGEGGGKALATPVVRWQDSLAHAWPPPSTTPPPPPHPRRYQCVVMVGDGATDMQARPPADAFIGYGGVVVREPVRRGADWFVTHFDELLAELRAGGEAAER